MNIAYFLLPKNRAAFLYDDCTFRQGLEKMRHHGYKVIPVITREGRYVGTVSEGDFLWRLLSAEQSPIFERTMRDLEHLPVREILHPDGYPSVGITASMEELLTSAMNQNFIPVVDDAGIFIGLVTRKEIIRYLAEKASILSKQEEVTACSHPHKKSSRRRAGTFFSVSKKPFCPAAASFETSKKFSKLMIMHERKP